MIAVTIGVGRCTLEALQSAREVTAKTGLATRVLGEDEMRKLALPDCRDLKFRIFDLVEADDILYFDSDQLCVNPWDPTQFAGSKEVIAVRDRPGESVRGDARKAGVPIHDYFNSGFFIVNRQRHAHWLREAERMRRQPNTYHFYDQTHLNAARMHLGLPIRFLSARYNWIRYGAGTLCFQLPVFMGHCTSLKALVGKYFDGSWRPPICLSFFPDDLLSSGIADRAAIMHWQSGEVERVFLRADGFVLPAADPDGPGLWFAHRVAGTDVLTRASYSKILGHFRQDGDTWREISFLEGTPKPERGFAAQLIDERLIKFVRVGHASRPLELLADGRIGIGRSSSEDSWFMVANGNAPGLAIAGQNGPTCRLTLDSDGAWRGRLFANERIQVALLPSCRAKLPSQARQNKPHAVRAGANQSTP